MKIDNVSHIKVNGHDMPIGGPLFITYEGSQIDESYVDTKITLNNIQINSRLNNIESSISNLGTQGIPEDRINAICV